MSYDIDFEPDLDEPLGDPVGHERCMEPQTCWCACAACERQRALRGYPLLVDPEQRISLTGLGWLVATEVP